MRPVDGWAAAGIPTSAIGQDGGVTHTGRWGTVLRALGAVGLLGVLVTAPAVAEPPPDLVTQINDVNGELADGEDELRTALAELDTEDGIELYVVSVDSTDGQDIVEWGDDAAIDAFLGDDQPVLVLATEDDDYAFSVGGDFGLDETELDRVRDAIEAPFAQGDYDGAAVAAAQAMQEEAGGGISGGWILGGLGVLAVAGTGVALAGRRKRGTQQAPGGGWSPTPKGAPAVPVEELSRQAGSMLVATDEDVRGAERELGFAQAEFGDAGVTPFATALAEAKQAVVQAFSLRQRLDDSEPETEQQQREMLEQIQSRCRAARETLSEQAEAFAVLRDVAGRIPQLVPALQQRVAAAREQLPAATETVQASATKFSPAAVEGVADAPNQAQERLAAAEQALSGSPGAIEVRQAEELVAQAEQLLVSVPRVAAELQQAGEQLPRAVAALSTDLGSAQAHPGPSPQLQQAVADAQGALDHAQRHGRTDPVGSLGRVTGADTALDQALAGARELSVRVQLAAERLPGLLTAAASQVAAAEDLVATSRSVAGSTARQQLAQATQLLAEARAGAGTIPLTAAEAATRSEQLARSAAAQARADASGYRWDSAGDPGIAGGTGYGGGGIFDAIFGSGWSSGGGGGGWSGGGGGGGWSSSGSRGSSSRRSSSSSRRSSSPRRSSSRSSSRRSSRRR